MKQEWSNRHFIKCALLKCIILYCQESIHFELKGSGKKIGNDLCMVLEAHDRNSSGNMYVVTQETSKGLVWEGRRRNIKLNISMKKILNRKY